MNPDHLIHIIKKRESKIVEFKKNFNNDTIIALAAFANTNGGTVLVGVDDKGKIVGVSINNESVQNSIHLMNVNEISQLHLQSLQTSWDAYLYPGAKLDDLDFNKVDRFIEKVNNNGRFYLDNREVAG